MSSEIAEDMASLNGHDIVPRIREQKPPITQFNISTQGVEPTLDEARADFAASVGSVVHMLFSKHYGPLVGDVTKTTVETTLKSLELAAERSKGDVKLVVEEIASRIFPSRK
jgi:hypothetical protein